MLASLCHWADATGKRCSSESWALLVSILQQAHQHAGGAALDVQLSTGQCLATCHLLCLCHSTGFATPATHLCATSATWLLLVAHVRSKLSAPNAAVAVLPAGCVHLALRGWSSAAATATCDAHLPDYWSTRLTARYRSSCLRLWPCFCCPFCCCALPCCALPFLAALALSSSSSDTTSSSMSTAAGRGGTDE